MTYRALSFWFSGVDYYKCIRTMYVQFPNLSRKKEVWYRKQHETGPSSLFNGSVIAFEKVVCWSGRKRNDCLSCFGFLLLLPTEPHMRGGSDWGPRLSCPPCYLSHFHLLSSATCIKGQHRQWIIYCFRGHPLLSEVHQDRSIGASSAGDESHGPMYLLSCLYWDTKPHPTHTVHS